MSTSEEITALIPHRNPFLFVDRIISVNDTEIVTEKRIDPEMEVFEGHYPEQPLMPGVLLCEAIFQSGALLMANSMAQQDPSSSKVPVLTRIKNAKFKQTVLPGDILHITVKLIENISSACFFKGTLRVAGKTAVQVEFTCALANTNNV